MNIAPLIFFMISSMGLTHIIADSSIMKPFRDWLKEHAPKWLFHGISCHQCMGFWSGLLCGYLSLTTLNPLVILACGFGGSWLGLFSNAILSWMETYTGQEDIEEED